MGAVAASNFVSARMRGAGRFGWEAAWRVAGRCVSAVAILVLLVGAGVSLAGVFLAWTVGLLIVLAFVARRWLVQPRWGGLRRAYPLLMPLLLLELFFALLFKGDVAIAAAAGLAREPLSYYAACGRLVEAALLLFAPFAIVLLRKLRLSFESPQKYALHLRQALAIAFGCGLLAWFAALWAGSALVPALFGPDFTPAGDLLPWVMACVPLAFANQIWVQGIVALRRERALPARLAAAAAFATLAIATGTVLHGAHGAAVGFAAGHAALALLLAPLARVGSA
jgi:O-antigen/teichoic acid export membrane protein